MDTRALRSLLFVPAHDERKLARGLASGADALILDLEDAVPGPRKAAARASCAAFVDEHRERMPLFVRVNGLDTGLLLDDLAAVVRVQPYGILLPKCRGARDVLRVDAYLSALEARDGLPAGRIRILPIVTESSVALLELSSYADGAGPRLCGMLWGGEDLAADVGTRSNRTADGRYTAPFELARSLTLHAATAAQVTAIDAVYTGFRDAAGLAIEAEDAARDGFGGKAAIHPDQIGPIHAAFTPTPQDIERARGIVQAFADAPEAGAVALDGRMIDRPHLRAAQRVLARAQAATD